MSSRPVIGAFWIAGLLGCAGAASPRTDAEEQRTAAVTSIVPSEADARVARVEELLRRVPGLEVRQQPDGNYELRIRGHHTLSGRGQDADPLLLIDGLPISAGANASALAGLAPRDVARIDVLKDASATSLYGSRGANGVIIITTKRARVAEPPPESIHDMTRAQPPVVDPGPAAPSTRAPSDAVVLFDGRDLSQWRSRDQRPASWKVENGYMEVVAGAGAITTVRAFGDCQMHIEWASPAGREGTGQDRGNSGVFLMGRYEVQVLDSYQNVTYPDGQAAAIYGQYPPLVNASRPPGEWQSYDIVFRRPRFNERGELIAPARITVMHNGVVVQDGVILTGPSGHRERPPYSAHADRLPIALQDHASPVRFRNIWVRDLER